MLESQKVSTFIFIITYNIRPIAEMLEMLQNEFSDIQIAESYKQCCEGYPKVSPEIEKITQAIDDLARMVTPDLVKNCAKMEQGIKDKCAEIKRQKMLVRRLLNPVTTAVKAVQVDTEPITIVKETVREVEKIVRVPVEVVKEVVRVIEKPVVSEKIVEVTKFVEKPIMSTQFVEVEKPVERIVEKVVEREKIVEVEKVVEKPVEKIKVVEVEKRVEVPIEVVKVVEKVVKEIVI